MKYDKILDALQSLLVTKELSTISVSEIAQTAGIGKGSIYYYFPSKDAILDALIRRNYEQPLQRLWIRPSISRSRRTSRHLPVWP